MSIFMPIPFKDLITDNTDETNRLISKQLNSETTFIHVDEYEKEFLVCLLKSTIANKNRGNFYCEESAKKVIKNHDHMIKCIQQVAHFHSHNVKFPDSRVSKQRIITTVDEKHPKFLTSANVNYRSYGWANDSSDINKSRLFNTRFIWKDAICNLHELFREKNAFWLDLCKSFGMLRKTEKEVIQFIKKNLLDITLPTSISPFSPIICFPIDQSEVFLTPVISHDVLVEQERLINEKLTPYKHLLHLHSQPASIGKFIGTKGGRQRVFDQRPRLPKTPSNFLKAKTTRTIEELLDKRSLLQYPMVKTLKGISQLVKESPSDKRKDLYACLESQIDLWLQPIEECRQYIRDEQSHHIPTNTKLLNELLQSDNLTQSEIVDELFQILLGQISHHKKASCFAFHPRVIKAAKPILRRSLKKLNSPKDFTELSNQQEYCLHFKQLRVSRANALSNPHVLGLPSLTALFGFVRRFQFKLFETFGRRLKANGISWFIHEYNDYQIYAKPQLELNPKKKDSVKTRLPVIDWQCDMIMDIVIPLNIEEEFQPIKSEYLLACLPSAFASGAVHLSDEYDIKRSASIKTHTNALAELSRLPASGRWVTPTENNLSSFKEAADIVENNPTHRLVNIGYTLLEEPSVKKGSNQLHAYAECATGIAKLISPIEFRVNNMKNFFKRSTWHYTQEKKHIYMQQKYELGN